MSTEAKRLPTPEEGRFPEGFDTGNIAYWKDSRGVWMLYLPAGGLGDLSAHDVTEHDDGTITVSPSILVTNNGHGRRRHGFLKRGVWEACSDDRPLRKDGL